MHTPRWTLPLLWLLGTLPRLEAARITEDATLYAGRDRAIGTLRADTVVTAGREDGDWIQVTYETWDARVEGFVRKSSVSVDDAGPAAPKTADKSAAAAPDRDLQLTTYWANGSRNISDSYREFMGLLKEYGSGSFAPRPTRSYTLYQNLTYLMPVQDAIRQLGLTKTTTDKLKTPGLPADSLTGYSASGNFDGFGSLMLVADLKGQLVAVQLGDRDDKDLWLRNALMFQHEKERKRIDYSERWRLVNLFDGRMKGSADWQVGYIITPRSGVLSIESEMISGSSWQGRSKERYRTILPEHVVDLLLQIAGVKR